MMLFRFKRLSGAAALAVLLFSASIAWAQVTTANLSGVVQDTSNSVIPGAEVVLTNDNTGLIYNTQSGADGDFLFSVLPTGTYTLTIQTAGFKVYEATGITLAASQNIRQMHTLEVGALTETVTVEGAPPLISTQASEQTESISQEKVAELPLGRRNITNILRLSSGVDVGGGGLRINGMGKSGTGVTVNGTDANSNPSESRALEQYGGRNYMDVVSIEAVEEVQIMRGVMKAENGGVISGTINLISKQGTNQWHGSAFENYRSHLFNAREPFQTNVDGDGNQLSKNREVFNQFGGSIGGPIVKNKLFVFGVYEGYREYANQRVTGTVATQEMRDTILEALPFQETVMTFQDQPLPNVPFTFQGGTDPYRGRYEAAGSRVRTEDHVIVRGDYRPTDSGQFTYTYTRNRPFGRDPRYNLNNANDRDYIYRTDRHTAGYTHTGGNWVSESRFGWNNATMDRFDNFFALVNPDFAETEEFQNRIPRFRMETPSGRLNLNGAEVWYLEGRTTTLDQKFTLIKGNHTLKFGARLIWNGGSRGNPENPYYEFDSIDEMFDRKVNQTYNQFGSGGTHTSRQYEIGGFVQDDWRVSNKLMLNLGIRYDYYSNNVITPTGVTEVTNKNLEQPAGGVGPDFAFGGRRPFDRPIENDGWVNLGPRMGFAYEMNTQTVIRGGAGIMFAGTVPGILRQSVQDLDLPRRLLFSRVENETVGLMYPMTNEEAAPLARDFIQSSGIELVFSIIDPHIQNPYTINYQLNIQRQLTDSLMWEIGYVGVRGVKFPMHRRFNLPDRVTNIRPNPLVNPGGTYVSSDESAMMHSLQTSFRKRMTNRLSFDFHYTYGQTMAFAGGDVGLYYATDSQDDNQTFDDLALERSETRFSTRHRAVADVIYELPRFESLSAPLRAVVGGWQFSGIYSGNTGTPIYIRQGCSQGYSCRPDYAGGAIYTSGTFGGARPGSHQDVQYLNPDAFTRLPETNGVTSRPGNVSQSFAHNVGRWVVDFNVSKRFTLAEGVQLQIRAEMFNVLNHVNLSSLQGNIESSDFGTFDNAGSMRNMQMGMRLTF